MVFISYDLLFKVLIVQHVNHTIRGSSKIRNMKDVACSTQSYMKQLDHEGTNNKKAKSAYDKVKDKHGLC